MVSRAGAVGATVIAVGLLCPSAALAGPRPGERYDGRSATGNRIMLTVRSDGRRLHRYFFGVRIRCTDGSRRLAGLRHPGERPVEIDAAGAFAHRSPVYRYTYGRARGRVRVSFSGAFDASGDTATGTIEATFRSRRFDCSSGPVAFTVHRDGTARAPYRDALMATGLYTAMGRGVTVRLRTHAPSRGLMRATIRFRTRCRAGRSLRAARVFVRYPIRPSGRVRATARLTLRDPGNPVSGRARVRLTLRFSAGTRVSGVWRMRATLVRGGRAVDTPMRSSFRGSFQRGPV